MTMLTRNEIIIISIGLVVAFAFGRYSVSPPDTKTIESVKTDTDIQKDTSTHKETTITKDPKGNEITKIVEDTNTSTKKSTDTVANIDTSVTAQKKGTINISGLAGTGIFSGLTPVYGVSASKEFIGPITVGAFGLTNGILGVSIGLNF